MKKIGVFLLFLTIFTCLVFSESNNNIVLILQTNTTHYIFEDVVNVRSQPTTKSSVVGFRRRSLLFQRGTAVLFEK